MSKAFCLCILLALRSSLLNRSFSTLSSVSKSLQGVVLHLPDTGLDLGEVVPDLAKGIVEAVVGPPRALIGH